jgi:hypothetical protein
MQAIVVDELECPTTLIPYNNVIHCRGHCTAQDFGAGSALLEEESFG